MSVTVLTHPVTLLLLVGVALGLLLLGLRPRVFSASLQRPVGTAALLARALWQQRLQAELSRSGRYGSTLSVMLLDIDHFRRINDCHGRRTGDGVIEAVALWLHERLRDSDCLGEYREGAFAILLPETSQLQAEHLGQRLQQSLAGESVVPGEFGDITLSIGIASSSGGVPDMPVLLAGAEAALDRAKSQGRNRVCT
ncbi:GGDEF domain-containing protein [Marinobacterium weihaiense]|uniref:diguanylate cyclase n=1 Tax=Marinobacterium weihaiense TaxID=2851016 RepID=A0ABS6M8D8_9GAMM|nr:GGDEF domain-containing protein [Marinobacterium weihaiense]MBV0932540.1 GGDEF domain-containing protein [Marinobacterium weihaiense]